MTTKISSASNPTKEKNRRSDFINRIGEVRFNRFGSKMKIVAHLEKEKILVKFENGFETTTKFEHFDKGRVHNPYDKTILGIGFVGEGPSSFTSNYKQNREYTVWYGMMRRCYSSRSQKIHPSYVGCTVCDEWHNFQNFAKWYKTNFYSVIGKRMELDKDILYKGNRIYSPDTCCFVTQDINILFIKNNNRRGDYPIGVTFSRKKYLSQMNVGGGVKKLGIFNSPEEAFTVYKTFKENLLKNIAEEYKHTIPFKLYQALLNYKVEIGD